MFNRFICIACGTKLQGNDFSCPKCHNTTSIIPLPPELWEYDRDDGKKTATYLPVGWSSFDKALGGGLARSSMTTLCGDEGIGKSTLSLQLGNAVAQQGKSVFYVNTEEHRDVLVKRAHRLKTTSQNLVIEAGNVNCNVKLYQGCNVKVYHLQVV
ncbi:MAG: ATPase domain-containing protein [Elusimicrobiota bacterium]